MSTISANKLLFNAFLLYYPEGKTKESTRVTQGYRLNAFYDYLKDLGQENTPKNLTQENINGYSEFLKKRGISPTARQQYVQLVCRLINKVLAVKSEFREYDISPVTIDK
ncbi:MAG: phage integrase SAM-like domain-containing protein [Prevotella sp.]|nr:phage integrase SAM-like domain-containing protein [Prevotella sp.]